MRIRYAGIKAAGLAGGLETNAGPSHLDTSGRGG